VPHPSTATPAVYGLWRILIHDPEPGDPRVAAGCRCRTGRRAPRPARRHCAQRGEPPSGWLTATASPPRSPSCATPRCGWWTAG